MSILRGFSFWAKEKNEAIEIIQKLIIDNCHPALPPRDSVEQANKRGYKHDGHRFIQCTSGNVFPEGSGGVSEGGWFGKELGELVKKNGDKDLILWQIQEVQTLCITMMEKSFITTMKCGAKY